ncbi:MAG: hemerythrin family protein [Magnetococcales bacterium]|nr:hemerythrin family protein [Magnetococcales bacterium]
MTNPVPWSDAYCLGIPEVDGQHRRLFQIFDELNASVAQGTGIESMATFLLRLKGYMACHFRYEEMLMKNNDYPDLEGHAALHHQIRGDFNKLRRQFDQSESSGAQMRVVEEMVRFLHTWLMDHIHRADRAFGLYLHEKSVL